MLLFDSNSQTKRIKSLLDIHRVRRHPRIQSLLGYLDSVRKLPSDHNTDRTQHGHATQIQKADEEQGADSCQPTATGNQQGQQPLHQDHHNADIS